MPPSNTRSTYPILICLLLAVVTGILYLPVRSHQFISLDDGVYLTANPHVQQGLTPQSFRWAFTTTENSNWHPLTWLSHMLDWQLFHSWAGGHHLTSLVFHILNTLLLFLLLNRTTGALWRSAFVAALFAWHPSHVESVAWAAERKDVLSAFFGLLTLLAYTHYAAPKSQNAKARIAWYSLALALFALGLMAKPMLVTLPFLMLLLDFWPLARFRTTKPNSPSASVKLGNARNTWRSLALEKLPFFLLATASCVVTFFAQRHGGAVGSFVEFPLGLRVGNSIISYLRYILKMVWPVDLIVFYSFPPVFWRTWQITGAALILSGITVLALRCARTRPWLPVGWFWYLGMLVPVIGLVQVGSQSMADRYTYLPFVGLFIVIAWGGSELLTAWRIPPVIQACAAAGVLAACILATANQLKYWHDDEPLLRHALAVDKNNLVAHFFLGLNRASQGRYAEARGHLSAALERLPGNPLLHNNLGIVLVALGENDAALAEYSAALKCSPDYFEADYNLSGLLIKLGRLDEAAGYLNQALKIHPALGQAHYRLGCIYLAKGQPDKALEHFSAAARLEPENAPLELQTGIALTALGKSASAIPHFRRAIALKPDDPIAYNELAWILAANPDPALRHGAEAVSLAERACQLTSYQEPICLSTLDAAYAEAGRFDEAIATAQKTQAAFLKTGQTQMAKQTAQRIKLYQAGRPYHDEAK